MLNRKTSSYWRICWFLITPLILIIIFLYTVATLSPLTYGDKKYPATAHAAGIIILCFSVFQIPFWMIVEMLKNRKLPLLQVPRENSYIIFNSILVSPFRIYYNDIYNKFYSRDTDIISTTS